MVTLDKMKAFGADTAEGLARCMNNEAFYLKMIGMGLGDKRFETLETQLAEGDKEGAFDTAHALKGVLGNLAITPIYEPMSEMTELLRAGKDADYVTMYKGIKEQRDTLLAM